MPRHSLLVGSGSSGALAALILASSACATGLEGWDGDFDICPNGPDPVSSVVLEPGQLTLRLGDEVTLLATQKGRDGEPLFLCPQVMSWANSTPAVATLSLNAGSAIVRAVAAGTAVISAHAGGRSDTSTVTVSVVPIASLAIEPGQIALRVGQATRLSVSARDSAGNALAIRTVTWSSDDVAVATVSGSGVLVGAESGTATVRATVEGRTVIATIPVTRDPPDVRIQQISAGYAHTCAIAGGGGVPDGTAFCWGAGEAGQLGVGGFASNRAPRRVTGGLSFTSISAGQDHTCATTTDAATYCWGANASGQLGDSTLAVRASPVRVSTTLAFRSVAVMSGTTCALVGDGAAYCWGASFGGSSAVRTPAPFAAALRFAELLDGGWAFMCGRTLSKQVYCWGRLANRDFATPTLMSGTHQFEQIDVSTRHVCGVVSTGESYCWGSLDPTVLGAGVVPTETQVPTLLQSSVRFSALVPSGNFTCGVATAGAYCLGSTNLSGSENSGSEPYAIPDEGRHRFTKITGGAFHACAIDTAGGGWCWGRSYEGQLGVVDVEFATQPSTPRQLLLR